MLVLLLAGACSVGAIIAGLLRETQRGAKGVPVLVEEDPAFSPGL